MENTAQRPLMVKVWIGLLTLTLIEVLLAYVQLQPSLMLGLLMGFSVVKAAMIMAYFMHQVRPSGADSGCSSPSWWR
ncbi:MAG: cytochrome C oxidase subunit IV family protein [Bryobacterales bacterium]